MDGFFCWARVISQPLFGDELNKDAVSRLFVLQYTPDYLALTYDRPQFLISFLYSGSDR